MNKLTVKDLKEILSEVDDNAELKVSFKLDEIGIEEEYYFETKPQKFTAINANCCVLRFENSPQTGVKRFEADAKIRNLGLYKNGELVKNCEIELEKIDNSD